MCAVLSVPVNPGSGLCTPIYEHQSTCSAISHCTRAEAEPNGKAQEFGASGKVGIRVSHAAGIHEKLESDVSE